MPSILLTTPGPQSSPTVLSSEPTSPTVPDFTGLTAPNSPSDSLDVNVTSSPRLALYSSSVPSSISGAPLFHGRHVPSRFQSPAPQAEDSQSTASTISQSGNRHPSISAYSSSDHSPPSSPLAHCSVRNSSPAPTTSSISSHNTSIFQTEDEELNELSQLANVLSSIPLPLSRDDAFHSLGAATAKKKTVKLERDLAHALLREARMYTKILHMKAKWAEKRLRTADVHISRINLVIKQSGHNELLLPQAHKSLSPESMPVFFEGDKCFVNAVDGPLSIYLD